jgi:putative membrane-bound dehydrogenase-like protein
MVAGLQIRAASSSVVRGLFSCHSVKLAIRGKHSRRRDFLTESTSGWTGRFYGIPGFAWTLLVAVLLQVICKIPVVSGQEKPSPEHALQAAEAGLRYDSERTAAKALGQMVAAEGLEVSLVASEPLVRQPVAIEFDDRGRLWVIQYLQYPNPEGLERVQVDRYSRTVYDRVPPPPPNGPRGADRITILEDTNGDGVMDSGRDFVEGLNLATGLAFGHGGVFVLNVPYLLFYPDEDRDDIPDGDPVVLLSGFGMEDAHSVANSLCWGPDGWLYGCQGSTVSANIRGITFQQGVWRYHPELDRFELFCEGGGNSWGVDFDATGELLYSTNYGGHILVHGVQGGYFVKSFAKHGPLQNRFAYGYFDHALHENFRGGHVTVGGIVYQADSLPRQYRDRYIAADLLGHNVYWHEIIKDSSTVRTRHGGQLLVSNDTWFAPCDVATGPDGAIYVADWHDARTAHPDPDADWDRSNGRIYRIAPPGLSRPTPDFAQMSVDRLVELHRDPNQWMVRRARLELVRRGDRSTLGTWRQLCLDSQDSEIALQALWTLHALSGFDEDLAFVLLDSPFPAIRKWVIRLLGDQSFLGLLRISDRLAHRLDSLAETEDSIEVRQQLACTAARLPAHQAIPIINANILRDEDYGDPRLPLLWWWATERHSLDGRDEVLARFTRPTVWQSQLGRSFLLPRLVRRYVAEATMLGLDSAARLMSAAPDEKAQSELWPSILAGWQEQQGNHVAALRERVATGHPLKQLLVRAWNSPTDDLSLTRLAIEMGHTPALDWLREAAFNSEINPERQAELLQVLAQVRDTARLAQALDVVVSSSSDSSVRVAALGVAAHSSEPQTGASLLAAACRETSTEFRARLFEVLLRRLDSARLVFDAIESGELDPTAIPIELVKSAELLRQPDLEKVVVRYWGKLQPDSPGEILAEIRRLNNDLRAAPGHADAGRAVFQKHCASCHELFGEGTKIGPDLTSANRQDRDFLLTSLVDPDNLIRAEYVSLVVHTSDGQVITGLPVERTAEAVTLVNSNQQRIQIATVDIEQMAPSPVSLMPQELYKQFSPDELRDLFAYLQSDSDKSIRE